MQYAIVAAAGLVICSSMRRISKTYNHSIAFDVCTNVWYYVAAATLLFMSRKRASVPLWQLVLVGTLLAVCEVIIDRLQFGSPVTYVNAAFAMSSYIVDQARAYRSGKKTADDLAKSLMVANEVLDYFAIKLSSTGYTKTAAQLENLKTAMESYVSMTVEGKHAEKLETALYKPTSRRSAVVLLFAAILFSLPIVKRS